MRINQMRLWLSGDAYTLIDARRRIALEGTKLANACCRTKKPYLANRVLALLSKAFNLAEVWGWRPDGSNPCRHVERYRENRREHYLSR